jgi:hypothetical protein
MKIKKEKVRVKAVTNSAIIIGYVHIIPGGRISDYITSQVNKFIPVTEADVYPINNNIDKDMSINGLNDIIFLNVENIEMLAIHDDKVSELKPVLTSNN